jgi:protein-disulfide isomerase
MSLWYTVLVFNSCVKYMEIEQQSTPVQSLQKQHPSFGVPIAIVIASVVIAGAIVFTGTRGSTQTAQVINQKNTGQITPEMVVAPVTDKDHIRGNPNAPIVVVEYSDFDCPFCKNFHETMNRVISEYGEQGKVAWVFRQFPLAQLHPNAPKVAAASECVAQLGGNEAFWKFADLVYGDRSTNEPTQMAKLAEYAQTAGVKKSDYERCVSAGTFDSFIDESIKAAMAAGARGTPYSVMIVGDQQGVISGAQPYENVKKMIDTMLTQIEGS